MGKQEVWTISQYKEHFGVGQKSKPSKYRNRKVTIDGITFDSIAEGERYKVLRFRQEIGDIAHLRVHRPFLLWKFDAISGKEKKTMYEADFTYLNKQGVFIVEDVKGKTAVFTPEFTLKKVLFEMQYKFEITIIRM